MTAATTYKVKINDRSFEVEIKDLRARPIIAVIDGDEFEVWPEDGKQHAPAVTLPASAIRTAPVTTQIIVPPSLKPGDSPNQVRAPIPGVIIEVRVKPGDQVSFGQELCILEAMKMKNTIRAPHAGEIASINAQVGQHVKHRDVLVEFKD